MDKDEANNILMRLSKLEEINQELVAAIIAAEQVSNDTFFLRKKPNQLFLSKTFGERPPQPPFEEKARTIGKGPNPFGRLAKWYMSLGKKDQ